MLPAFVYFWSVNSKINTNYSIDPIIVRSEASVSESMSRLAACTWLHNPLVMNVSTRGSAESVIVALVLLTIHLYQQKVFLLTGLVYGLAIHLKIYPLIFCLSLYVPLTQKAGLASLFDVNVARCGTKSCKIW